MTKDFDWFWDNYDKDPNREHQWVKGRMQSVSSGVCKQCEYEGTAIGGDCTCGAIHTWCYVCWGYWPNHEASERYEREF